MILDLRNNPGGSGVRLRSAVRIFFATGRNLGHTVDRSGKVKAMDTLSFRVPLYEGKVVILINARTASSAEIFSRALQFYPAAAHERDDPRLSRAGRQGTRRCRSDP
jgi:C-terminal processing protease CtpA/Prc